MKAPRGNTPVPSSVEAEPVETAEAATERLARQDETAIERAVSEKIGWKVQATRMSITATKLGFAPVTVHCSSVKEAADKMLEIFADDNYTPMKTTAPKATSEAVGAPAAI